MSGTDYPHAADILALKELVENSPSNQTAKISSSTTEYL
jgi:hypothetical protein